MKRHFCEAQNQGNGAYTKTKQTSKKQNYPKQKQRYKYYNNKLQWTFSKKLTRNQYFNYILTKTFFAVLFVCLLKSRFHTVYPRTHSNPPLSVF